MTESATTGTDTRTRAYLRMGLTPGLGIRCCHRLLARIDAPQSLFALRPRDMEPFGIPADLAGELLSPAGAERADSEWQRAANAGIRILDLEHPEYPRLLLETPDPPLVLYLRGGHWAPERPHLAVVGSRHATPYGLECAERLAGELAARGLVIVSGLARGIDTAAHRGALGSGTTVAVCGTGVDRIYPRENRSLADSIIANGALLSEFPLGTPPLPAHFPRRNRILAGMSLGTIVVEAAERSGSLITARLALEANRDVFAVPGPVHSSLSHGPHALIRQGACLAGSADDVIEELGPGIQAHLAAPPDPPANSASNVSDLSGVTGKHVLGVLPVAEATAVDELVERLDWSLPQVYAALFDLELAGLVRQLPGDRYVRVR